tara:strand:+ start:200 stop:508 length:309 start_codon:yes stop_codon:yes gene_type:complete
MANLFDGLTQFITKDFVTDVKKIFENPNSLSENVISYLKENNIDLNNILDVVENKKTSNYESIKEENINVDNDSDDYDNLFLRLNNIEYIMAEIKEYLKKDN